MARPTNDRKAQRYLGDPATSLVHDSIHEDPTPGGCQLGKLIRSGGAVAFDPDKTAQARAEGFEFCPKCFYRLEARPSQVWKTIIE
jgi:hypothetical protein